MNRKEKISFVCEECDKERIVRRESFPDDYICSYCKAKKSLPYPDGIKICNKCGKEKPYSEFHRKKSNSDGFNRNCKECENSRKRRKTTPQKKIEVSPLRPVRGTGVEPEADEEYYEKLKKYTTHCSICGKEKDENFVFDYLLEDSSPVPANIRYICKECKENRPKNESDILAYHDLNPSYSREEMEVELENIRNSRGSFLAVPRTNKIVLSYQPHFYEIEKEMWKDVEMRKYIFINRMKYINKNPFEMNDREILRAFKICGKHYGFSHFSPFWIKAFIEEYNINSIYDPCGGWGHRLLGAWDIKYYYNDYDYRSVEGVKKINDDFKGHDNLFFNEDASLFSPDLKYEAVFTCPPYFKKEKYLIDGTSTDKYSRYKDWLNIWWRNVIKNTNPSKYFAFIIDGDLVNDMCEMVEKEGYKITDQRLLGKSKSHFTSGKKEIISIFERK